MIHRYKPILIKIPTEVLKHGNVLLKVTLKSKESKVNKKIVKKND